MAPSIPMVAALLSVSRADLDESSMLQMPIVSENLAAADDECRCPGYFEAQCVAEEAQGCRWSSAGSSNGPWCQCLGEDTQPVRNPETVTLPPQPQQAPRFVTVPNVDGIYWEAAGIKYWVSSCSLCNDSPNLASGAGGPCETFEVVTQSYMDGLETDGLYPGTSTGSRFVCTQHPLYVAPAPVVTAACPIDWVQQGEAGADISGCGLQSCDERYGTASEAECAASCDSMDECAGFSYAPLTGDRNHGGVTVCTMYNTDIPTGVWTGTSGTALQVFCARPIADLDTTHWIFGSRHEHLYLAGHAAGDSTIRTVNAAATRCDELGEACGGITCRSESSCTVRAGTDLLTSPSGEFSFKKTTSIVPVAGSFSSSHVGQYLGGYAAGDSTIRPISESQEACNQLGDQCGGITCRSETSCTVRTGPDLRTSPSGEFSFVRESPPLEYVMVDGCENQNTEVSRAVVSEDSGSTASVRCCSIAGDSCDSDHAAIGGCQSDKTYAEATAICAVAGERLCTEVEIDNRLCCGTGCNFDGHQIWVLHESINPNYSASHRDIYLAGYAGGDSTIRVVSEAQAACDTLADACGGITCRSDTSCTVRAGTNLQASPSGEFSFQRLGVSVR